MKKIICCLLVAVMLSACSGTKNSDTKQETNQENAPRKEGEKRVGDIIMVNGELGVVFAVTTDGKHGKAVSISETKCDWSSARSWCAKLGHGWRLPTKEELWVIYRKKSAVDPALSDNGYEALSNDWYWSSNSYDERSAWYVGMRSGYTLSGSKSFNYCVRAVSVF